MKCGSVSNTFHLVNPVLVVVNEELCSLFNQLFKICCAPFLNSLPLLPDYCFAAVMPMPGVALNPIPDGDVSSGFL